MPTLMTYAELDVAYLSRSAYVVTVTVDRLAPPVVPPVEANPSAVFDQVRPLPPMVGPEVAPDVPALRGAHERDRVVDRHGLTLRHRGFPSR
ncbi:hypothetical protein ACPPVO_22945 [Dactylosporangium sp. McL0621]|uniref:hypothetical protein n=1 Tax=Dactylosporangium sp. McL0621 TaxID=3415678 RepID=UPI003CE8D3DF